MARPVIGIVACNRIVGGEAAQSVMSRYAIAALAHASVSGLIVPALPDLIDANDVADRLDALLLTGSPSNVAPSRYRDTAEGTGPFDHGRDEMVHRLTIAMTDRGRPVFGICRGFQELNVIFGGTLRRDVSGSDAALPHHASDDASLDAMFEHHHPVTLTPGGLLARSHGGQDLEVNSVHYQGIDRLAPGAMVEARAPDGLVEAFSMHVNGAPVVAVQWHPEWKPEHSSFARRWFHLLGQAARGDPLLAGGDDV